MKIKAMKAGFAVTALALAVSPAMAAEIRFDGFASFVAGQVLDKDELVDPLTGEEVAFHGFDNRLDFQQNSLFALQARADLQEKLSATAQIVAKGSTDYEAKFNWAYLTYELTNEWTAKLGRQRIPYFMYSDFLDVGYAYHWISPPDTVYNLAGFDSADGVSLENQTDLGDWTSRLTLMAGRANTTLNTANTSDIDTEISELMAVAWSMNYDWFTARLVYAQSEVSFDIDTLNELAAGLGAFGVSPENIDNMLVESDRAEFSGVGISIDPGSFFVAAEYTELSFDNSAIPEKDKRWYVSGGLRFGQMTVYATIEGNEAEAPDTKDAILNEVDQSFAAQSAYLLTLGLPAPQLAAAQAELASGYAQLAGGTTAIFNSFASETETYSVGLRYNFHPSATAKVEYIEQDDKHNDLKPQAVAIAIDLVY